MLRFFHEVNYRQVLPHATGKGKRHENEFGRRKVALRGPWVSSSIQRHVECTWDCCTEKLDDVGVDQ